MWLLLFLTVFCVVLLRRPVLKYTVPLMFQCVTQKERGFSYFTVFLFNFNEKLVVLASHPHSLFVILLKIRMEIQNNITSNGNMVAFITIL